MAAIPSPIWAIQSALYSIYSTDATLTTTLGYKIFSLGAQNESERYPYLLFGEATENDWNTLGQHGSRVTISIHLYSRYEGTTDILKAYDRIKRGTHFVNSGALAQIDDWTLVHSWARLVTVLYEMDGLTQHGIVQVGFLYSYTP